MTVRLTLAVVLPLLLPVQALASHSARTDDHSDTSPGATPRATELAELSSGFAVSRGAAAAAQTVSPGDAPPGSPAQQPDKPIVVTPVQEVAWGNQAAQEFLAGRTEVRTGDMVARVQAIGRRLAPVSDRPDVPYRFRLVRGDDLQAYSFPGGNIFVTVALVDLFGDDGQLASVIGHELSHVVLRHHVTDLRFQAEIARGAPGDKALLTTVRSRLGRDAEMEADRFGALYAVRAGYDFSACADSLELLAGHYEESPEDAAHPAFGERISALKAFEKELRRSIDVFEMGVTALGEARPDAAIDYFTLFVWEFPNSIAGRVNLGASILSQVQERAGTPGGLSEALPILPEVDVVLRGEMDEEAVNRARDHFEKARRLNETEPMALAGLGLADVRLGHLEEARSELRAALDLQPGSPEISLCLGNVEFVAADYRAAIDLYDRALALRSAWAPARRNLALAKEKVGDLVRARELWTELAADERLSAEAHAHLDLLPARQSPKR